jgi:uncharacterized protein
MEEILASIRRIISDDEQNPTRKPAAAAPQNDHDDEGLEATEGEADDRIINDIARVLSGGGGNTAAPEAPVEASMDEEEDILDLTAELGGLEPFEETLEAEVVDMVEVVAEDAPTETAAAETPAPEVFEPAPAPQLQAAAAPEPVPAPPPLPMSASDEAASALERAIAALRAGQLPTSFSEFSASPAPVFQTQPLPEPVIAPEPVAAVAEPQLEFAPEAEVVLAEFEAELVIEEPVVVETVESERRQAPPWEADAPSFTAAVEHEAEREAPRTNGHRDYASAAPRTLEDSVKDLLRPMLRQWLDENMARVLTSALRDELKDNPARFQQD